MRTQQVEVYSFDDLDDNGKENARQWWRECENAESPEIDNVADDFEAIATILGITFEQRHIPLMNGKTRAEPCIWYSGFSSQGDGACFEGNYYYAKGAAKAIREYAPQDKTLHQIADDLQAIQRPAFYKLCATTRHSGHYYHAGCMSVTVEHDSDRWPTDDEQEAITEALRDFANWIYGQLEAEYEYRMSDENVDESIRCNEYEFSANGSIF